MTRCSTRPTFAAEDAIAMHNVGRSACLYDRLFELAQCLFVVLHGVQPCGRYRLLVVAWNMRIRCYTRGAPPDTRKLANRTPDGTRLPVRQAACWLANVRGRGHILRTRHGNRVPRNGKPAPATGWARPRKKERSLLRHLRIVDEEFDQLLNCTIVAEQPACHWCSACGALLIPRVDGLQDTLLAEAV
eukprot:7386035-Prymnesium_polylepis.4